VQRRDRAGPELGVLVEQQRVASAGALQQRGVVLALAAAAVQSDDLGRQPMAARRGCRAVRRGVVEHEHLGLERQGVALGCDRIKAAQQQLTLLCVDHAEGDRDRQSVPIVTPRDESERRRSRGLHAAYDRALCAALARAGADVELLTAPFPHGEVPPARGFAVREDFYRHAPAGRGRRWARLATHVPDMLRASRRDADVVHFQWLAVQPVDQQLLRAFARPR
jgi:hypothetical protein